MAGRSSNRDRIAKMALEAAANVKEKKEKKATAATKKKKTSTRKTTAKRSTASAKASGRMKVQWAVCDPTGKSIQIYLHSEEELARAEAKKRTADTGKTHFAKRDVVPFE